MNRVTGKWACLLLLWVLLAPATAVQGALQEEDTQPATLADSSRLWHYGAYLDVGYAANFNFPDNDLWRSRTTASRHNQPAPNMVLAYVRKDVSEVSRWGMELGVQGGYDSVDFAYLQGEKKVDGADVLRHLHRANASYLAPVGNGLTVTAGLFNSLMGYESLYAKDNANYSRSWIADNTPYMMFGVNAAYPVNDRLTVTGFVINRYYHRTALQWEDDFN
ncbi:MAG: outer membrane beta-barrel protein [Nitrospira sp.]|nr:outer membrane beta-barrel protein [Nitrospira sp.]